MQRNANYFNIITQLLTVLRICCEKGEKKEQRFQNSMAALISSYGDCLLNLEEPIAKRTHAAFHIRTIGTEDAVKVIASG